MTLENKTDVWFGIDETEPCEGAWLVLNYHHDGESRWCSVEQAKQRLVTIRTVKPEEERPLRLRRLGFVRWTPKVELAWKAYEEATESSWKAYDSARASSWKVYEEATAPSRKAYEEDTASASTESAWKVYEEAEASARKKFLSEVTVLSLEEWEKEARK